MIWHTNETDATATTSVRLADTLRYLSVNGGQGFQTMAYWISMGLPNFNLAGVGHPDSGINKALIPVSVSFTGVPTRVSVQITAFASNTRVRTFRWRIANGRTDLGQGQTLGTGVFTCPYGTSRVTIDCPVTVLPQTFFVYLEPWTNEYGNIHITGTTTVTVHMAAGAIGALSYQPYIYHNGIFQPASAKLYSGGGWQTGG